MKHLIPFFLAFTLSASAQDAKTVTLKDAAGKDVGTAKLTPLKHGVQIKLDVQGLKPGEHALHFHQNGTCTPPDFKSAGDHFNPTKHEHGFNAPKGPHGGDMPNIVVGEDGKAELETINTQVTLGKGGNSLVKQGGTALVIHAKADDYSSQPAGNAGDRIACGEIK